MRYPRGKWTSPDIQSVVSSSYHVSFNSLTYFSSLFSADDTEIEFEKLRVAYDQLQTK